MTVSSQDVATPAVASSEPPRPVQEVAVTWLFGPSADLLVRGLLPLRIPPPAVVVAQAAVGLGAAFLVQQRSFVAAALVLQLKTLLDNADGRLARASGRVTLLGRYLDTELDFVVNAALFAALGAATEEPLLALGAFVALTLLLTVDFGASGLHREARGGRPGPAAPSEGRVERVLRRVYALLFAPQDRLVRALSARRLERVLAGEHDPARIRAAELVYHDRTTVTILANLGLSTQLLLLGVLLAAGVPVVYLWLVVAALFLVPVLQIRRERLARRSLAS